MQTNEPGTRIKARSAGALSFWQIAILAVAPLLVGVGLLTVRHYSLRDLQAAANWRETPCVIERCEFVRHDEGQSLEIVYRYEVDGREFRGDRLGAIIGRMGDARAFEQRVHDTCPPGATAICYVDPEDPSRSFFDRDHGRNAPRRLWLLAFPFLFIGAIFAAGLLSMLVRQPNDADAAAIATERFGPPPRSMPWLTRAAVMAGPPGSQLAWSFLVGFVYVFVIMDGPDAYARLFNRASEQGITTGRVTDVRVLDGHEMGWRIHQYTFAYHVGGKEYTAESYTRGSKHQVGDEVAVSYRPGAPDRGAIVGARASQFLWWHSAIPLGVVLLLIIGLGGMLLRGFRTARLLVEGQVVKAIWRETAEARASDSMEPRPPVTMHTRYRFEIAGRTYGARAFGDRASRGEHATVLYRASNPDDNVIVDHCLAALMDPRRSAWDVILHAASGPLCILVLVILMRGAELI